MYDLEERAEDAVAAYLRTQVGDMKVYEAWSFAQMEFPCVAVHCGETSPISETADWHDAREMKLTLAVMTEAADKTDDSGNVLLTARQRNRQAKSDVIRALSTSGLCGLINATGTQGIFFSMIQLSTTGRTVDEGRKLLITTLTLDAIATPQEA